MVELDFDVSENRILMYAIYTVLAVAFYGIVFNQFPKPGIVVLALITGFLLKDIIVDMWLLNDQKSPWLYTIVEHNPFNYVLILALIFVYDASAAMNNILITEEVIIGLAFIDMIIDGSQDVKIEFG